MAVFKNRSGAYFMYVSSGSAENRHLQAAMATFGSGSKGLTKTELNAAGCLGGTNKGVGVGRVGASVFFISWGEACVWP